MIKIFSVILIDSKIISKLPIKIFSLVLWVQIILSQFHELNLKFSSCGVLGPSPNNNAHKYQVTTQQLDEPNIKFTIFLLQFRNFAKLTRSFVQYNNLSELEEICWLILCLALFLLLATR